MADAVTLTKTLERKDIAIKIIDPNPKNPNKMGAAEFNLLVDNIGRTGLTDAVLVRPHGKGRYVIVGGHHRFDAAKFLGFEEVPCTVITDPTFDEEAETFQMVRMNTIRGKMTPDKFYALYEQMSQKYSDAMLQDMFGFADEAEFRKLVTHTANTITDPVMKAAFVEAAKEVKTIDGLAKLLNEMFTKYGDSVPYGFMVFDYGGQRSVWLQVSDHTLNAMEVIGTICREKNRTVDDIVGRLLQLIANGDLKNTMTTLIKGTPPVVIPKHLQVMPTKMNIEQVEK